MRFYEGKAEITIKRYAGRNNNGSPFFERVGALNASDFTPIEDLYKKVTEEERAEIARTINEIVERREINRLCGAHDRWCEASDLLETALDAGRIELTDEMAGDMQKRVKDMIKIGRKMQKMMQKPQKREIQEKLGI